MRPLDCCSMCGMSADVDSDRTGRNEQKARLEELLRQSADEKTMLYDEQRMLKEELRTLKEMESELRQVSVVYCVSGTM